jgi:flavin reductase (DIM6/NTAB) family NADH-FMN oxidoreductase RutF
MVRVAPPTADTRPPLPGPDDALRRAFLEAMSRSATPVWLVTTAGPAGLHGLTVSAVSAVSAEPPMLLACINRRSPVAAAVCRNRLLAASLLAESQAELADLFAGRHPTRTREDGLHADLWETGPTGAPLLRHAVAAFDCRLEAARDAGTHRILIGAVLRADFGMAEPLLHHRRRYTAPAAATTPTRLS